MSTDEIITKFIQRESISFELRAVNGYGEVLAKVTSDVSADDLSGQAWTVDTQVHKLALSDEDDEDFSGATEGDR